MTPGADLRFYRPCRSGRPLPVWRGPDGTFRSVEEVAPDEGLLFLDEERYARSRWFVNVFWEAE